MQAKKKISCLKNKPYSEKGGVKRREGKDDCFLISKATVECMAIVFSYFISLLTSVLDIFAFLTML